MLYLKHAVTLAVLMSMRWFAYDALSPLADAWNRPDISGVGARS